LREKLKRNAQTLQAFLKRRVGRDRSEPDWHLTRGNISGPDGSAIRPYHS
jgi:hypothetical protein